jgi:hypothetical protein
MAQLHSANVAPLAPNILGIFVTFTAKSRSTRLESGLVIVENRDARRLEWAGG